MLAVSPTVQDMMSKDLMGKLYIPVKDVIKSKGQLEQEWPLQLNGNPAGKLALALRWTEDAGTEDPTGAAHQVGQRKNRQTVSAHAAVKALGQLPELDETQLHDDFPDTLDVPAKQPGSFTFSGHEAERAAVSGTTLAMPSVPEQQTPTGATGERALAAAESPTSTQPPTPALSAVPSLPRLHQVRIESIRSWPLDGRLKHSNASQIRCISLLTK